MDREALKSIPEALKQIDLIDNIHPYELPLYVNYNWVSDTVKRRYLDRLEEAQEVLDVLKKAEENKHNPDVIEF